MLSKLTDLCITKSGKWITLVIWLVFASVVIGLSPSLDTSANTADFLPDDVAVSYTHLTLPTNREE